MADGPNAFTYMRILFVISISIYVIMFTFVTIISFLNKGDISIPSYDIVINKINKLSIKPPENVCNQSYNKDTQDIQSIVYELYNMFGDSFLLTSEQNKIALIKAYRDYPEIFYSQEPSEVLQNVSDIVDDNENNDENNDENDDDNNDDDLSDTDFSASQDVSIDSSLSSSYSVPEGDFTLSTDDSSSSSIDSSVESSTEEINTENTIEFGRNESYSN